MHGFQLFLAQSFRKGTVQGATMAKKMANLSAQWKKLPLEQKFKLNQQAAKLKLKKQPLRATNTVVAYLKAAKPQANKLELVRSFHKLSQTQKKAVKAAARRAVRRAQVFAGQRKFTAKKHSTWIARRARALLAASPKAGASVAWKQAAAEWKALPAAQKNAVKVRKTISAPGIRVRRIAAALKKAKKN